MNSAAPVAVIQTRKEYTETEFEEALATIRALLPRNLIVLLAYHLRALGLEQTHGKLEVELNAKAGRVRSADFSRRTHWSPPPTGANDEI